MGRIGDLIATCAPVRDWDTLEVRWRALEARVPASFFQSWTWVGCLGPERFPDPWLLELRRAGETVGLALWNRRAGPVVPSFALQEAGMAALDTPYVEHNGILGAAAPAAFRAMLRGVRPRRLVLSGIDDATLAAVRDATRWVRVLRSQPAPFLELGRDPLAGRDANTRAQLRRSERAYGTVAVSRAATEAEAWAMLDELAALHQARWEARGQPGAFVRPFFRRFHRALIAAGLPRGEIDLLRVTGDGALVGLLYNFRYRGVAYAYQGGFAYEDASGARKPGLTCHLAAVRHAAAAGLVRYDFLAGDAQYKRSLSDGATMLHWVEAGPGTLPAGLARALPAGLARALPAELARALPARLPRMLG